VVAHTGQLGGEVGTAGELADLPDTERVPQHVGYEVLGHVPHVVEPFADAGDLAGELQAPVPQGSLMQRDRPHLQAAPGLGPDRVEQHQVSYPPGRGVCERGGHAAAERVPDHQHRLVDAECVEEGVDPGAVALDRSFVGAESGGAAEPRQVGGVDAATLRRDASQRPAVRAMAQCPAVQEEHRHAAPAHAVRRRPTGDLEPLADQMVSGSRRPGFAGAGEGEHR
jgi:hypothetical protein